MQIENNYDREVFNGDMGWVSGIDREEEELSVTFNGRLICYPFGELDELVLCYATTIHKSQGSEYPVVVIPISTQHYRMPSSQRRLSTSATQHVIPIKTSLKGASSITISFAMGVLVYC